MPNLSSNLPIAVQVALGSGYVAYLIAYAGLRQHHTAADATFRALVFGLPATAILATSPFETWLDYIAAVALCLAAGTVWRVAGMPLVTYVLRASNVSWANDLPSAWLTITAERTDLRPSQIAVDLEGGRLLLCEDTRKFATLPYGPCTFGLDGSIAMYVTSELRPDGTWIEKDDVEHRSEGAKITYIPAAAVKRVELRYWSWVNGSAAAAAEGEPGQAEEAEPEA